MYISVYEEDSNFDKTIYRFPWPGDLTRNHRFWFLGKAWEMMLHKQCCAPLNFWLRLVTRPGCSGLRRLPMWGAVRTWRAGVPLLCVEWRGRWRRQGPTGQVSAGTSGDLWLTAHWRHRDTVRSPLIGPRAHRTELALRARGTERTGRPTNPSHTETYQR